MAISPDAIEEFLGREFRDSKRWKETTVEKIKDYLFEKMAMRPRFEYEPYHHQWVCLGLGWLYNRFYFALDMGLGKSKIVIDLFRFRRRLAKSKRMLVTVPNIVNVAAWQEQLREHGPELSYTLFTAKSRAARERQWTDGKDVLVATYAGLRAMLCERVPGKGMQPVPAKVRECLKMFDFYVLDEASAIGSPKSLNFRLFRQLSKSDHPMYLLSGTLFGKDPQVLWPQMFILDGGWLLGKTLGMFRACMFREQVTPWSKTYILRQSMREKLHRMLRHSTVRFSEDEALDLPDRVGGIAQPMVISVPFSQAQWRLYDAIQLDAAEAWEMESETRPEAYLDKRYALAGYRRVDSMGLVPIPGPNPKLDALSELLGDIREQFGQDEKIVVVHHYQQTGAGIAARLKVDGVAYREIRGSVSARGMEEWKTDKTLPVLVASKSAAYGLNLQCARIMIFFETPDSIEVREQIERRIYRIGQTNVTYYYDLVIDNSLDGAILHALRKKRNVWKTIVEGDAIRQVR